MAVVQLTRTIFYRLYIIIFNEFFQSKQNPNRHLRPKKFQVLQKLEQFVDCGYHISAKNHRQV
jgi:hypothetical protein